MEHLANQIKGHQVKEVKTICSTESMIQSTLLTRNVRTSSCYLIAKNSVYTTQVNSVFRAR